MYKQKGRKIDNETKGKKREHTLPREKIQSMIQFENAM